MRRAFALPLRALATGAERLSAGAGQVELPAFESPELAQLAEALQRLARDGASDPARGTNPPRSDSETLTIESETEMSVGGSSSLPYSEARNATQYRIVVEGVVE